MEINGQAIILESREYSNDLLIISALFEHHGIKKGAIKTSKKNKSALTTGNILNLRWYARLEHHLGSFSIKSFETIAPFVYHDKKRLLSLLSICSLYKSCLAQQESQENLFLQLENLLYALKFNHELCLNMLALLEVELLARTGFGLDLNKCVVSGTVKNLKYISPKTGKAVSEEQGEKYKDKLLLLPELFINPNRKFPDKEIAIALRTTRYFLEKHIFSMSKNNFPNIRKELENILNSN